MKGLSKLFPSDALAVSMIVLATLALPLLAYAQVGISPEMLSLKLSPENITPGASGVASLQSSSVDLNRASITWYVNGAVVLQGTGKTSAPFKAGTTGKPVSIRASVALSTGERVEKSISISPADVDLILEAGSYVHPFYKGKTLPPTASAITIVAIPNIKTASGQKLDSKNLVFTWSSDGTVLGSLSGAGKNLISILGPQPTRTRAISVKVSSLDNTLTGSGSLVVTPMANRVLFYESNPLLGILFENALSGDVHLGNRKEISVLATPFYFSTLKRLNDALSYAWQINNSSTDNPSEDQGLLTLRPSGEGVASVGIEVLNTSAYLEKADGSMTVTFKGN